MASNNFSSFLSSFAGRLVIVPFYFSFVFLASFFLSSSSFSFGSIETFLEIGALLFWFLKLLKLDFFYGIKFFFMLLRIVTSVKLVKCYLFVFGGFCKVILFGDGLFSHPSAFHPKY